RAPGILRRRAGRVAKRDRRGRTHRDSRVLFRERTTCHRLLPGARRMSTATKARRKDAPGHKPTPKEIRAAREAAGLTQAEASHLIYSTLRSWQRWEAGDRAMHPAVFELFRLKAGLA